EEVTAGAVTRQYAYGLQRISHNQEIANAWTPAFYGYDGGGTVRLLTDSTGTVTDTYDYDAWGNAVNTTGFTPNVYLYRGEQYDSDLGLYYLRARYYNPQIGRFLTRDPEAGRIKAPATLHKYLYAGGDPVNRLDPTGRDLLTYTLQLAKNAVWLGRAAATAASGVGVFGLIKNMCIVVKYSDLLLQAGAAAVGAGLEIPESPELLNELMDAAKDWCEKSGQI